MTRSEYEEIVKTAQELARKGDVAGISAYAKELEAKGVDPELTEFVSSHIEAAVLNSPAED